MNQNIFSANHRHLFFQKFMPFKNDGLAIIMVMVNGGKYEGMEGRG